MGKHRVHLCQQFFPFSNFISNDHRSRAAPPSSIAHTRRYSAAGTRQSCRETQSITFRTPPSYARLHGCFFSGGNTRLSPGCDWFSLSCRLQATYLDIQDELVRRTSHFENSFVHVQVRFTALAADTGYIPSAGGTPYCFEHSPHVHHRF